MAAPINSADLFDDAQNEGIISPGSASLLTGLSHRIDQTMQALAVTPTVTEQTLLTTLIDNTPSMEYKDNHKAVIAGYNLVIEALSGAKAVNSIEVLPLLIIPNERYIRDITGGDTEFRWKALRAAEKLTLPNFIDGWTTPFYERALVALGSAVARTKFWEDQYSVQVRTVTLLMSDGENNVGGYTADDVANLVRDMQAQERHRIFFWGIQGQDRHVDFRQIGRNMSIPEANIDVLPSDPKAIRAKFALFSQSMTAAAQATSDDDFAGVGFGK